MLFALSFAARSRDSSNFVLNRKLMLLSFSFQVTCPGTFLRDCGYVYLKVNCMGLEVNTKSVAPTFPLFFHERLRFERVSRVWIPGFFLNHIVSSTNYLALSSRSSKVARIPHM